MRAAHITQSGSPTEAIEIVDIDRPIPGPNEVLLRVEACALNHKDVFARVGHPDRDPEYPKQTGTDVAGVVADTGQNVSDERLGDRVNAYPRVSCGDCEFCERGEQSMCPDSESLGSERPGGLAEFLPVPVSMLEPIPEEQSFVTAAAWPVTFTTAWRMIITAGQLRPAETALILGASGGVGNAALQIADRVGATTYAATSSVNKADRVDEWADEVIRYDKTSFDGAIAELTGGRGVDLVADHVGQATWQRSIDALSTGGRMVICGATSGPDPDIDIRSVYQRHRRIIGAPMGSHRDFRAVGRLIAKGELVPEIDSVLDLDETAVGHERLENRGVVGKVVIQPNG